MEGYFCKAETEINPVSKMVCITGAQYGIISPDIISAPSEASVHREAYSMCKAHAIISFRL